MSGPVGQLQVVKTLLSVTFCCFVADRPLTLKLVFVALVLFCISALTKNKISTIPSQEPFSSLYYLVTRSKKHTSFHLILLISA